MDFLSKLITCIIMASSVSLRHTKGVVLLLAGSAALLVYFAYRNTLAAPPNEAFSSGDSTDKSAADDSTKAEQSPTQPKPIQPPKKLVDVDGEPKAAATQKKENGKDEDDNENDNDDDDEDDEDEESDCDPFERFRAIMDAVDLDKVKHAARILRTQQQPHLANWSDGLKWILRIPGHGLEFDANDVIRMNNEYRTMEYIRSTTTIPIPQVFFWETDCERIGVPFAFMSFVEGQPLYTVWFELSDDARLGVLSSLAAYMSQLRKLEFPAMGMLHLEDLQTRPTVGPIYSRELELYDEGWGSHHVEGPYVSMSEQLLKLLAQMEEHSKSTDGVQGLLKMLVESIPMTFDGNGHFYPSPDDLNFQNIMVNEAGEITGIIDWDNVTTKPAAFGYARYPLWITRDWDPVYYEYSFGDFDRPDDVPDASRPEELLSYRRHYAAAFAALSPKDYDPLMTKASHILEAICVAVNSRLSSGYILGKIIAHAFGGNPPFTLPEYVESHEADDADDKDKLIKVAFSRMWQEHEQWEEAEKGTWQFFSQGFK
ncbi:hypothetical protein LTR10_016304 [Elasticomyces elasticus]|nr:hypothetical protein LTR10_016304 [Elasticomyces elasticus]KAK5028313.1 hypothetical protein LTS07_006404 [Exophiala sideris]